MALAHLSDTEGALRWLRGATTGTLRTDSRQVRPGDAFFAWPGRTADGRRFVAAALRAGAARCLVDGAGADALGFDDARIAALPGLKAAAGTIADAWYGAPSRSLQVIAVTGTNGKSSVAWWTAQALSALGRRCGVVGTLGVGEPPLRAPGASMPLHDTGLTTPDAVTLQATLRRFADLGLAACAIEASSIGIVDHRLNGTRVAVALFTNLTRDHLDYHGSMQDYWSAKRALFDRPELRAAVVNVDDEKGAELAQELRHRSQLDLWTYSARSAARLRARGVHYEQGGLAFEVAEVAEVAEGATVLPIRCRMIGDYNVCNLLAVLGALRALGIGLADAVGAIAALGPVPGRMQRVDAPSAGLPEVVVDYAHTPDALEQALHALRPLAAARGGRLWCVFGCGGNRDATKRPLMGALAHQHADHVVLTSDNPRDETPALILAQILAGVPDAGSIDVVEDRRAAIGDAVARASEDDVILLAGKGHEATQEIAGVRRAFSDVDVAAQALRARAAAQAGGRA